MTRSRYAASSGVAGPDTIEQAASEQTAKYAKADRIALLLF